MQIKTAVRTCAAAVLGAAAFFIPPVLADSITDMAVADPLPVASPSPCNTGPLPPSSPPNVPPTAPGTPEVVRVLMTSVQIRWEPATDDGSIACYLVRELKSDGTSVDVATFQPAVTEGIFYLPWPPSGVSSQTHQIYLVAVDNLGTKGPASGTVPVTIYNDIIYSPSPTPTPTPSPDSTCHVEATSSTWASGMTTSIAITNTGSATVSDWRLTFDFADPGQQVDSGWSATWSQTGSTVTAAAMSWNSDIAPGQTLWIGFNGTHTGANPTPAAFRLNGALCS